MEHLYLKINNQVFNIYNMIDTKAILLKPNENIID